MEESKRQTLALMYSAHKEEVLYRHKVELVVSILNIAFFTFIFAALILLHYKGLRMLPVQKALSTFGLVVIADVMCYFMTKNYKRSNEIQRVIVSIDSALGLFDRDAFSPGAQIYPDAWKKHGEDRPASIITRCLLVAVLTLCCISLIWVL